MAEHELHLFIDDYLCSGRFTNDPTGKIYSRSSQVLYFSGDSAGETVGKMLTFPMEMLEDKAKEFCETVYQEKEGSGSEQASNGFDHKRLWNFLQTEADTLEPAEHIDAYLAGMIAQICNENPAIRYLLKIKVAIPFWTETQFKVFSDSLHRVASTINIDCELFDAHEVVAQIGFCGFQTRQYNHGLVLSAWHNGLACSYWVLETMSSYRMNPTQQTGLWAKHTPCFDNNSMNSLANSLFDPCGVERLTDQQQKVADSNYFTPQDPFVELRISQPTTPSFHPLIVIGAIASKCLREVIVKKVNSPNGLSCGANLLEDVDREKDEFISVTRCLDALQTANPGVGVHAGSASAINEVIIQQLRPTKNENDQCVRVLQLPCAVELGSGQNPNAPSEESSLRFKVTYLETPFTINLPLDEFDADDKYLVELSQEATGELRLLVRAGTRPVCLALCKDASHVFPKMQPTTAGAYRVILSDNHDKNVSRMRSLKAFVDSGMYHVESLLVGSE